MSLPPPSDAAPAPPPRGVLFRVPRGQGAVGDEQLLLAYYVCVAGMGVVGVLLLVTGAVQPILRSAALSIPVITLALALGFAWLAPRRVEPVLLWFNALVLLVMVINAKFAWGVHTPSLAVVSIFVFAQGVLGSARSSLLFYAACVTGVVFVYLAPPERVLTLADGPPASMRVALQVLSLTFSLAIGQVIGRALRGRLRESRMRGERYQRLFDGAPIGMVLHRDNRVIEASRPMLRLLGYPDGTDLQGEDLLALHQPEDAARVRARMAQLAGEPLGTTLVPRDALMRHSDGRAVPVRVSSTRLVLEDGPAVLSFYSDESERYAAEAVRRRTQDVLSAVIARSPYLMSLVDTDTARVRMVNPALAEALGWTVDELVGRSVFKLGVWPDPEELQQLMSRLNESDAGQDRVLRMQRRDGAIFFVRLSIAPVMLEGQEHVLMVGKDITDERAVELERGALLQSVDSAIVLLHGGIIAQASQALEQLVGWPPGSAVGQPSHRLVGGADVERSIWHAHRDALKRGESVSFEVEVVHADGHRFPCLFRGRIVDARGPWGMAVVWVLEDRTRQREVEDNLRASRDAAVAASKAKGHFLATMSHEIRTPLNGIIGLTDLLRAGGFGKAQQDEYLEMLDHSARALMDTISGVLDLSKIEAGHLELECRAFDLLEMLNGLHATYDVLARSRGVSLHTQMSPRLAGPRLGDPVRLRQILQNYLSNALKHTTQGEIRLSAQPADAAAQRVRLTVSDTGSGIAVEEQARLFQPYQQAAGGAANPQGGTGLGLAICRELATLMGGAVGVDSRPGRGSSFWVELPLAREAMPAPVDAKADAKDASDATGEAGPTGAAPAPAPARGGADAASLLAAQPLAGTRVLIVDDNRINRVVARRVLERAGAEVAEADDGFPGLQAIEAALREGRLFDVVLMDLNMPKLDGMTATRRLRMHPNPRMRALPILALTAAVLEQERQDAMDAGMDDFLTKPIDVATLCRAIERARRGESRRSRGPDDDGAGLEAGAAQPAAADAAGSGRAAGAGPSAS